eukprot:6090593-Amphidinium_carterae.1
MRAGRQSRCRKGPDVSGELYEVQESLRALPEEPVPEPAKHLAPAGPAPAELKLLLAYVQAKASEGCGDATSICGLLQHSVQDGGNQVRPVPELPHTATDELRQPGQAGSFGRRGPCRGVDSGRAGRLLQTPCPISASRQPACHDVSCPVTLCSNGGCEYGYRYTTRHGWNFSSTSSSWQQAGQATWGSAAGTGQFGSWRSGQRRDQDQREWSRFAQRRRGPRFCSRTTAGAQTRPNLSALDAECGIGCSPLSLKSATAGLTSPGQAGG